MKIFVSPKVKRKYRKLFRKDPKLRSKLDKTIAAFLANSHDAKLKLHKLSSRKTEEWSMSVEVNKRIIFEYVDEGILITDFGSHDEVY